MQGEIKKAVIPAAGWGTRFLPATKAQPKEMLPIIDKPAIQYVVEEVKDSGISDVLIITGKTKRAIEDHFDRSLELENVLKQKNNGAMLDVIEEIGNLMNIYYVRQKEQLGLGHAVYCAKSFICDEPFAVLLSDDIIISDKPCLKQMMEAYEELGVVLVAVMEVPQEEVDRYGIVEPAGDPNKPYFPVRSLVEKPEASAAPSNLAVIGRYILLPEVFPILQNLSPGRGGEIQLTDALNALAQDGKVYAYRFQGRRYDIGDKLGFLEATIDIALTRPDIKEAFTKLMIQRSSALKPNG